MSKKNRTRRPRPVLRRAASRVATAYALVLAACAAGPTSPDSEKVVSAAAVRSLVSCRQAIVLISGVAARKAVDIPVGSLGTSPNASAAPRCGMRPNFGTDVDVSRGLGK